MVKEQGKATGKQALKTAEQGELDWQSDYDVLEHLQNKFIPAKYFQQINKVKNQSVC